MNFLKKLWTKPKQKTPTPKIEKKQKSTKPRSQTVDISRPPPNHAIGRIQWYMEVYISYCGVSRRRQVSATTASQKREMERPFKALDTVVELSDKLTKADFTEIERTVENFLEVASEAFGMALFHHLDRNHTHTKWQDAAILLSDEIPEDMHPKIHSIERPSPYNAKLLQVISKLCSTRRRAEAVNQTRLTSRVVILLDELLSAPDAKLKLLTEKLEKTKSDSVPKSYNTETKPSHSHTRNQVQSFLVEDEEEDEDEQEDVKTVRKTYNHIEIAEGAVSTIRSFLCRLARFPSTGIELIRSNSLDLLLNLIYSPMGLDRPLCLRGQLIGTEILSVLTVGGFRQNVGELANYLDRNQIRKIVLWLPGEIDLQPSARSSFTSPQMRTRPRRRRVGSEFIGTRGVVVVWIIASLRSMLNLTRSHKLFNEFKRADGYNTFVRATKWLAGIPEEKFKLRLKVFNSWSGVETPMTKMGLLSVLLEAISNLVFSGPEALPVPNAKSELAAFDTTNRSEDIVEGTLDILRVRNLDGFTVLMKVFECIDIEGFKIEALNRILMVFSGHPDNYWLLFPLRVTASLIKGLPYYSKPVCSMVMKIVDSVAQVVQAVPFQELTSLSVVLSDLQALSEGQVTGMRSQERRTLGDRKARAQRVSEIAGVVIDQTISYAKVDKGYSELVGKCGMLDVMFQHIIDLNVYLQYQHKSSGPETMPPSVPVLSDLKTYTKMVGCVSLMLKSAKNLELFRISKCHSSVMALTSFKDYRVPALKILSVTADQRGISDMLELLHLSKAVMRSDEPARQVEIMEVISVMMTSLQAKDLWRKLAGYECMYTMLTRLQGVFAEEPLELEEKDEKLNRESSGEEIKKLSHLSRGSNLSDVVPLGDIEGGWSILRAIFYVLTSSIKDYPINRLHLWSSESWKSLAYALRLTGITRRPNMIFGLLNSLVALSVENTGYFGLDPQGERKKRDSKRHIHNPQAILIIIDLAQTMDLEYQILALSKIKHLCSPNNQGKAIANIEALSRAHMIGFLLHHFPLTSLPATPTLFEMLRESEISGELLESPENLQKVVGSRGKAFLEVMILKLVVLVTSHRVHPLELKLIFHMVPQPLLNQLLLRLSCAQPSTSFIELNSVLPGTNSAYIQIPSVFSRETGWVQDGFSLSMWINIRHLQTVNSEINLCRLETSGQVVCHFAFAKGRLLVYSHDQTNSKAQMVSSLDGMNLVKGCWYHIALVYANLHRRSVRTRKTSGYQPEQDTASSQCGSLKLYVDGKEVETAVIPMGLPVTLNTADARAIIGCVPEDSQSGSVWWLGPCALMQGLLTRDQISSIHALGFTSTSTLHPSSVSAQEANLDLPSSALIFLFHARANLDIGNIEEFKKKGTRRMVLESPREAKRKTKEQIWHWKEKDPKKIQSLFEYIAVTKSGRLILNLAAPVPPVRKPKNGALESLIMPIGILHGGATCISTLNIVDAIRSVSGIRLLFPPVAHCRTGSELDDVLTAFSVMLHRNRRNKREMQRLEGYKLLAQILINKGALLTRRSLDVVFSLVEDRCPVTGSYGLCMDQHINTHDQKAKDVPKRPWRVWAQPSERKIINIEAVKYLLLDFNIWEQARGSLQAAVFARLAQLSLWGPKHTDSVLEGETSIPTANSVRLEKSGCLGLLLHIMLEKGEGLSNLVVDSLSSIVEAILVQTRHSLPDIPALASYLAVGLTDDADTVGPGDLERRASMLLKQSSRVTAVTECSEISGIKGFLLMDENIDKLSRIAGMPTEAKATPRVRMALNIINVLHGVVVKAMKPPVTPEKTKFHQLLARVLNKKWFGMFLNPRVYPQVLEAVICMMHTMLCAPKMAKDIAWLSPKIMNTLGFAAPYLKPSWPLYTSLFAVLVGTISRTLLARSDSLSQVRARNLIQLASPGQGDAEEKAKPSPCQSNDSLSEAFDVFVLETDLLADNPTIIPKPEVVSIILHVLQLNVKSLLKPLLVKSDPVSITKEAKSPKMAVTRLSVTAIRFFNLLVHYSEAIKQGMWLTQDVKTVSNPASSNLASVMRGPPILQLVRIWHILTKHQKLALKNLKKLTKAQDDPNVPRTQSSHTTFQLSSSPEAPRKRTINSVTLTPSRDAQDAKNGHDEKKGGGGRGERYYSNPYDSRILANSEVLDSVTDLLCTLVQEAAMNCTPEEFEKKLKILLNPPEGITIDQQSQLKHRLFGHLSQRFKSFLSDSALKSSPSLLENMNVFLTYFISEMNAGVIRPQINARMDLRSSLGMNLSDARPNSKQIKSTLETRPSRKALFEASTSASSVRDIPLPTFDDQATREKFFICRIADFAVQVLMLSLTRLASVAKFLPSGISPRSMEGDRRASSKKTGYATLDLSKGEAQNLSRWGHKSYNAAHQAGLCQTARNNALRLFSLAVHDYGSNPDVVSFMFGKMEYSSSASYLFKREVVEATEGHILALDVPDFLFYTLCCLLHQHLNVSSTVSDSKIVEMQRKLRGVQMKAVGVWHRLLHYQQTRVEGLMRVETDTLAMTIQKNFEQTSVLGGFRRLLDGQTSAHTDFVHWYDDNAIEVDRVFNATLSPHLERFLQERAKKFEESKIITTKMAKDAIETSRTFGVKRNLLVKRIEEQRLSIIKTKRTQELQRQKMMAHHMLHRRMKMRNIYQKLATHLLHQTHAAGPLFLPCLKSYPPTPRTLRLYHHYLPMTIIDPFERKEEKKKLEAEWSGIPGDNRGEFDPPVIDGVRMAYALDYIEGPFRMRSRMIGYEQFHSVYGIEQRLMVDDLYSNAAAIHPDNTTGGLSPMKSKPGNVPREVTDASLESFMPAISKKTADILRRKKKEKKETKDQGGHEGECKASEDNEQLEKNPNEQQRTTVKCMQALRSAARKSVHFDLQERINLNERPAKGKVSPAIAVPEEDESDEDTNIKPEEKQPVQNPTGLPPKINADKKVTSMVGDTKVVDEEKGPLGGGASKEDGDENENDWTEILMLLPPGEEQSIGGLKNCSRISGLSRHYGVLFISKECMYLIDKYTIDDEGVLNVITEMGEETKVECFYYMRPKGSKEDRDRDEVTPPVLEIVKIRDKSKARRRQGTYIEQRHQCRPYPYDSIVEMRKRRYQLQRLALEIFNADGSSELLTFDTKRDRDEVFNKLYSMGVHSNPNDMRVGLSTRYAKQLQGQTLIQMALKGQRTVTMHWQDGEISNFTYLMYLNTLAGRSYNDLTQYPVFPWVIRNYESETIDLSDPSVYRDLSKPMGAIGKERSKKFQDRYRNWEDPSGIIPKFHYGTHYASAATTLYYLLRLEPFSRIALQLQGGKFDHADRLFYSIQHSWHSSSASGGMSDVKELIPEFYYLPDFLYNTNRFDLGVTQWKQVVHDVELPPWARGDPRRFVRIMRRALESEYVSKNLHHWIDLIFGHKQQGKAAEEAQNVFYYLTYEDQIDIDSITDPVDKMSMIAQINNFGQTPHQLFKRPHPPRKSSGASRMAMTLTTHANILIPLSTSTVAGSVAGIEWLPEEKLVIAGRNCTLIPPKYKRAVQWGHPDLSLWITSDAESWAGDTETRLLAIHEGLHDGQISTCCCTEDGKYIITGGTDARIAVWETPAKGREGESLRLVASLHGHSSSVTCLATDLDYQIIVSGAADGQVILWDLRRMMLQRRLPRHPGPISCLAINQNSGDVVTCASGWLFVWHLNTDLCAARRLSDTHADDISAVTVASGPDVQTFPAIITGHRDGKIQFWKLKLPGLDDAKEEAGDVDRVNSDSDPNFSCLRHEAPIRDSLCFHREETAAYCPTASVAQSGAKRGRGGEETGEEEKEKKKRNRRDRPYMLLESAEKRKLHTAAITALHCPSHDLIRLFSGDIDGTVHTWQLKSDEHWVQDSSVTACPRCKRSFGVLERRHHCRYCGGIFCNSCSIRKTPVPQFGHVEPVRVCNDCFTALQAKSSSMR